MTIQQVILALKTCSSGDSCYECPYSGKNNCADKMMREARNYLSTVQTQSEFEEKKEPRRGDKRFRAVLMLDRSGAVLQRFDSVSSAARACDCHTTQISACCSGRRYTAAGYRWKYEGVSENADNR